MLIHYTFSFSFFKISSPLKLFKFVSLSSSSSSSSLPKHNRHFYCFNFLKFLKKKCKNLKNLCYHYIIIKNTLITICSTFSPLIARSHHAMTSYISYCSCIRVYMCDVGTKEQWICSLI